MSLRDDAEMFALDVIRVYQFLTGTQHEFVMSKQLLRAGTSIGANLAEGRFAQSRQDFISKFSIALKEGEETLYWISLLRRSGYLSDEWAEKLAQDVDSLVSRLVKSIKTAKANANG